MAEKLQNILELAQQMTVGLGQDSASWKHYLECAGRFYKYPFHEQLLIYGQRPDATACASIDIWNRRMGRWVNKYARGIALLDDSGSKTRLKYVFDISDTHAGRYHPKRSFIWSLKERHEKEVSEALYAKMGISYPEEGLNFSGYLAQACAVYVKDNMELYRQEVNEVIQDAGFGALNERELGTDALGNIRRVDNKIEGIPELLEQTKEKLVSTKQQIQNAKEQAIVDFPYEEELREKQVRLDEVDSLLNLNQKEDAVLLEVEEQVEIPMEKRRVTRER